jgi:2-polyprenyl-3-methyl-5-hydroxy-6-metoxy-1,4-benzoquinol methylase
MLNAVNTSEWDSISDWLSWWFIENRLAAPEQKILDVYYQSYKKRFNSYLRKQYDRQTKEISSLIGKDSKVLEIGCGCGTESLWFTMLGAKVVGVDLNDSRLSVAKARTDYMEHYLGRQLSARFINASLFDLEFKESFDVIWLEQAFHHLEPRSQVPHKLTCTDCIVALTIVKALLKNMKFYES